MKKSLSADGLREKSFFYCLIIFVIIIPFSEALTSITSGILLFQAIVLTSWKHPSVKNRNPSTLFLITSIFAVYLIGLIFTKDFTFGLYELRKVMFWMVIPTAFFLSPALKPNQFYSILMLFCLAVLAASFTSIFKLLNDKTLQITNFREATLISHIRFSFHIILAASITFYFLFYKISVYKDKKCKVLLILLLFWFVYFLVLLRSLTGWIAFIGTSVVALIISLLKIKNRSKKRIIFSSILLLILVPVIYVSLSLADFYKSDKLNPDTVEKYTVSGNPYFFDFSSKERENGHYVWSYFCEAELRTEWNKKSLFKYDSIDSRGFPYSATLIRYLTSKGLRKDSSGVAALTTADMDAIEKGVANHIFLDHTFSLYPRIYETIWEIDHYLRYGDPNNQSASQRIEYIKASLWLIKQHPWFGIGTGNWKISFSTAFNQIHSKLLPENQASSHNQYLNYLVKFGFIGFICIMLMIIIPVFHEKKQHNLLFLLFLTLIACANLGDANLESHMGLSFFCFFYCFFLWNSPDEIKDPLE